jgi:osmotically-inducible protein OsmY
MIAVAGVVSLGACQRGPDVQKMADGALESVAVDSKVDANYDDSADVVRLSGTVDTDEERSRAVEAVTHAVGSYAPVANEVVVRGLNAEAADDLDGGIQKRYTTLMENSPEVKSGDVDLRVANGVVTLTGTTPTESDKTHIEQLVSSIPGVTQVVNSIAVDGRPTESARRP